MTSSWARVTVIWAVTALAACSKPNPSAPASAGAAGEHLFMLRLDELRSGWSFLLGIKRRADGLELRHGSAIAKHDSLFGEYLASSCRKVRKELALSPHEVVVRTAAFSELDFRKPNAVRFLGSMLHADSTHKVFEEIKVPMRAGKLAEAGTLHVYAFVESNLGKVSLYDLPVDLARQQIGEIRFNDRAGFERVKAAQIASLPDGRKLPDNYQKLVRTL